jgi:tetratricopeptide (TPR) repeat protein
MLLRANLPAHGNLRAVPVDVLKLLVYLHLARHYALPEQQNEADLRAALDFLDALADLAPELVPGGMESLIEQPPPEPADDAERFTRTAARAANDYEGTGALVVLDTAVEMFRDAVAATFPDHPRRAAYLSNLGTSLRMRFERTRNDADLNDAIDAGHQAIDVVTPGDPNHAGYLKSLESSLSARFERSGDVADLNAAIAIARQAVAASAPGSPELASYLSGLGFFLISLFEQTGDIKYLDEAIDVRKRAVDATLVDDLALAVRLSLLGDSLRVRFERSSDTADLNAAIDAGRKAVNATPHGDPNVAIYLTMLASSLLARFELADDITDLDEATDARRRAVEATPPGADRAGYLSNLGASLRARFARKEDGADLNAAIDADTQAITMAPPDDPDLGAYMSNLGIALRDRFERSGDAGDLDAAIDAGRKAVAATPAGHPRHARYLYNLEGSLLTRFERLADAADLDAAIDAGRKAVDATPAGHLSRAEPLSTLGGALVRRFQLKGQAADLDAAVDAEYKAVAATPSDHHKYGFHLSNLGASLFARFEYSHETVDLDAAIDAGRKAVAAIPPDHANRGPMLSNLSAFLLIRFEYRNETVDLEAAIDAGRKAVAATPPDHPRRVLALSNLGDCLFTRFKHTGDAADLDAAMGCWKQASEVPVGTPRSRLDAARRWGSVAANAGRTHEAAQGFAAAVRLLPEVAWHGLDRATREQQLAEWIGLAADAAACAILDRCPGRAVELLEQGRSVLWTQGLNLRSDLSRLDKVDPSLTKRLDRIRTVLDAPLPETARSVPESEDDALTAVARTRHQQDMADLHRRMAREWDDILAEIRTLDGFEHFLAAVPYPELVAAATAGPVVIVNASSYGCHALIINSGEELPHLVNLPQLSLDGAVQHAAALLGALEVANRSESTFPDREKARHAVFDVLEWLWDVIADPVLASLGDTSAPTAADPPPRIWWCLTGPLTVLPIHAAGQYPRFRTQSSRGANSVLDQVISSYTPTLTALTRVRQPRTPAPARHLGVGMPTTPRLPPLPAVPAEMEVLKRHFPPGPENHQLAQSQATRADVLAAVTAHSWVHMACHAGQQQADPDLSGFAVWDGTLTITDLLALPSEGRDLAFLSACQTAAGSIRHLDESIHLAAAMQFLGYRQVIATMWTIADSAAPDVADAVYTALAEGHTPDPSQAAQALHLALQSLRQKAPTNPLLWAPYIHLGP